MTEPEGPSLAAFFSQPADEDEPETTLAAFYAQPSDEEDEPFPGGGEGVTPETLGPLQVAERQHERDAIAYETRQTDVSPYGHVPDSDDAIAYDEPHTWYPDGNVPEPEPLHVQADRAQAEHHDAMIRDALEDLGAQFNGYVTGLVVQTKGKQDRLVWLDEMGLAP